jgi:two-component system response regulator HydG
MLAITIIDEFDFLGGAPFHCPDNTILNYTDKISLLTLSDKKYNHWVLDINTHHFKKIKRYEVIRSKTDCDRILLIHDIADLNIYINLLQTSENNPESGIIKNVLLEIRKIFEQSLKDDIAEPAFVRGKSKAIGHLYHLAELVAPTDYTVILYGETGTGKEIMAKHIHERSHRKNKPFVAIDCGCLNKEIAASELFGHVKGAFTDAVTEKTGAFESANGGTLFLDEIGNLPYEIQVLLLRSIQEQKIRKVGSEKEMPLDVRIIVASNENLLQLSQKGLFREDLYHRLNGLLLVIPPLRERKEDLHLFVDFFLREAADELDREMPEFTIEAWQQMLEYHWPGNIRELKNVLKQLCLLAPDNEIDIDLLPFKVSETGYKKEATPLIGEEAEYDMIMHALRKAKYNKSRAAEILNIHRKTLYNKLRSMNIQV